MIDFRYHVVSLISVFLALAVGIVLGAGPLKDQLGTTLTEQVQSLRDEKDDLRVQLGTANAALQHRDDFVTAVTPSLISGQLADRSVAILSLPEVEGDTVEPLVNAITTAGGQVTGQISINSTWLDPAQTEARAKVVTDLTAELPTGSVPSTGDVDARLAGLLARALVNAAAAPVATSTDASATVLDALRSADLIEVKGNVSGLAGGALMLAPANPVGGAAVKATPADDTLSAYVSLADALDTVGGGAVVTGPASSATDGGVLTAIRNDDTAKERVSTVDSGSSPMGVITAVLALREQLSGTSGAYGFGSGVEDLMPALVAAAPAVTASPTATKK
jgi:hypothetical protein